MTLSNFPTSGTSNTIITGTGAPASGTGNNGDVYLDSNASVLYTKASGAWNTGTSLIGGANATPVSGVVATLAATWSTSGTAVSWTVPATVNGQTVTKLVVLDIVTRLLSGTPGTAATYGISISGNSPYASRALPTQGGGVDVGMMNLNVNNISATYKMANPGDTIVVTSGGTFSNSTTWAIDIFGYYVGLSPGAPIQGAEFNFTAAGVFNPPGASMTLPLTDVTATPAFWIAPAAGYVKGIAGYASSRGSTALGGTFQLAVIKNQPYTTNPAAITVSGTQVAAAAATAAPALSAAKNVYIAGINSGNTFAAGDTLLPVVITSAAMTQSAVLQVVLNTFVQMTAI